MRVRHLLALALLSASVAVRADTLANVSSGTTTNQAAGYLGQSFTVLGSGSFSNVAFNFYSASLTPYAVGTGYLFSQTYAGTPTGLNAALPGYLGSATAAEESTASALRCCSQQVVFTGSSRTPWCPRPP